METLTRVVSAKFKEIVEVFDDMAELVANMGFIPGSTGKGILGTLGGVLIGKEKSMMDRVQDFEKVMKIKRTGEDGIRGREPIEENGANMRKAAEGFKLFGIVTDFCGGEKIDDVVKGFTEVT